MVHHGFYDSVTFHGSIPLEMFEECADDEQLEVHHHPEDGPAAVEWGQQRVPGGEQVPERMQGLLVPLDNFTRLEVLVAHLL